MNQQDHAIALGFGVADWGDNPTGYSVTYIPAWRKLKLTREYTFLDQASVTLIPGQWYQLKVGSAVRQTGRDPALQPPAGCEPAGG
ncbi:MAG: hypothetical protein J7M16_07160 [Anaerolineae bacterium]|nr:hypothetical protein [Anaerolineae bacterium]